MMGLFQELGPCGIDYSGEVYSNPYSWSNTSNMLFIDQPTQVGFSYSKPIRAYKNTTNDNLIPLADDEDCPTNDGTCGTYSDPDPTLTANSTLGAAPNFWKTIQGFMGVFPQYTTNGLNIATESYGGHYGPVFSAYILRQNDADIPGTKKIQLDSLLVGNGWFDPVINYQAYYNFTVWPGNTYDLPSPEARDKQWSLQLYHNLYGPGNCLEQLLDCKKQGINSICANADSYCAKYVEDLALSLLSPPGIVLGMA